MKYGQIIIYVFSIILGIILGLIMLNQYDKKVELKPVSNTTEKIYLLQQGVYSSIESMEESIKKTPHYIYNIENDKYHVYVAFTKDDKLKGYFENIGYSIYVKEINMNNKNFIEILEQYDLLLNNTDDKEVINAIVKQTINKYKELVIDEDLNKGNAD